MRICYLAGCITYYYNNNIMNKATEWRKIARHRLSANGIKGFDPSVYFKENLEYDTKSVPYQNLSYLQRSEFILINLNELNNSPGTIFELAWAFILKKPVIAFGKCDWSAQPHIRESITITFPNLEDAIDYIATMYFQ